MKTFTILFLGSFILTGTIAGAENIDFSRAVLYCPEHRQPVIRQAIKLLRDETAARSGIRFRRRNHIPTKRPCIVLSTDPGKWKSFLPKDLVVPNRKDGYALALVTPQDGPPVLYAIGHDPRGLLFAAGRLIRLFHYEAGTITISAPLRLATAPRFTIRGHQLAYGGTPNAYDAWDIKIYNQYIHDLILFGTNSIEFSLGNTPPGSRNALMKETPWEMTRKLSRLVHSYGLECWMKQSIRVDLSKPEQVQKELAGREELARTIPYIDNVFVPGGDPGKNPPALVLPFLEKEIRIIHRYHPNAGLWVSNQGFEAPQNDYLFQWLKEKHPEWLTGLIYGPWTKMTLTELRQRTPAAYRIRRFPDISHNVRCQYPVPDWDRALAHVLNRECINPRPREMYHIYRQYMRDSGDAIPYSEGVNEDLNKMIWSALEWDPETPLDAILHDYGKVFFSDAEADAVAKGLLMFEDNWTGPVLENDGIRRTLRHWQGIADRMGTQALKHNWRLQMYLFRAWCDAYVQCRAAADQEAENRAYQALQEAMKPGTTRAAILAAIQKARNELARNDTAPVAPDYRKHICQLGYMLFDSIKLQLSIKPPFYAANAERGAVLDTLDFPLNNRLWLENEFNTIEKLDTPQQQQARLARILHWDDPGPGSFYDDLGNPWKQPHLLRPIPWEADPGYVKSVQCNYTLPFDKKTATPCSWRLSWLDQATTLYHHPLKMRYEHLDPTATYSLEVVYTGRFHATMKLTADGHYVVHDWLPQPKTPKRLTFPIAKDATKDGILTLQWDLKPVDPQYALWHRSKERGCQVAEVWLLKNSE